jgi:hypothetical protein
MIWSTILATSPYTRKYVSLECRICVGLVTVQHTLSAEVQKQCISSQIIVSLALKVNSVLFACRLNNFLSVRHSLSKCHGYSFPDLDLIPVFPLTLDYCS